MAIILLGPNMDVIDTVNDNQLVSTGPAVDVLQCVGAQISNGRLFYTANGSGLQLSMNDGDGPPYRHRHGNTWIASSRHGNDL